MNLLLCCRDYKPRGGGIAEHAWQIASRLNSRGHNVEVLTSDKDNAVEFDEKESYSVVRIGGGSLLGDVSRCIGAMAAANTGKFNIVYCSEWFPFGLAMAFLSLFRNVLYVVGLHGREVAFHGESMRGMIKQRLKKLQCHVYGRAARVVAVSDYSRSELIEAWQHVMPGSNPPETSVIPNGIEVTGEEVCISGQRAGGDSIKLLTVGRLIPRKGHDAVLKALSGVLGEYSSVEYVIAGEGPYRAELERLAKELGVGNVVNFLGYVKEEEKSGLYSSSDVFVMPNRAEPGSVEGFGIVFLEAAVHGVPSIAGNSGGAPEVVLDGQTGLVVDGTSVDEVREAIATLVSRPALRRRLGTRAFERAKEEFGWGKIIVEYERLLRRCSEVGEKGGSDNGDQNDTSSYFERGSKGKV